MDIQKGKKERARSGGETKLVKNLQKWKELGADIWVLGPEITKRIFTYAGVKAHFLTLPKSYNSSRFGLMATFLKRIFGSFQMRIPSDFDIIYSASDFLFDLIPAIWAKRRNPHSKLLVCLYLIAPPPWKGYEKILTRGFIIPKARGIIFYLSQKLSIFFMKRSADRIQVCNHFDRGHLIKKKVPAKKIKVVSGGVDIAYISGIKESKEGEYDAAFLGRLQPQKGVFDLVKIWKRVCQVRPEARLALIDGGTKRAYERLKLRIIRDGLKNNIALFGFLKGEENFRILKSSKCFLCPSKYESWGIVVAEAMTCGLPVVAYNLPPFKELFPKGMISVPIGDTKEFASKVIELFNNEELRKRMGKEALKTSAQYDLNKIAEKELKDLENLVGERKE